MSSRTPLRINSHKNNNNNQFKPQPSKITTQNKFQSSPKTVDRSRSISLRRNDGAINSATGTQQSFRLISGPGVRSTASSVRKRGPVYTT